MTRSEHLLTILAEECAEIAQRCSKALRFTVDECQPGLDPPLTNGERIVREYADLLAVASMLIDEGVLPRTRLGPLMIAKRAKVETFLEYSRQRGTLIDEAIERA